MARALVCTFALALVPGHASPSHRGAAKHRAAPSLVAHKAKVAPALQPADVYDADYPVDMAKMTPQELRYKAQADYAKAIAQLKKEAAEAEAAQKEMERALKDYQEAEAAAKQAKLEAEDALKNKNRYSDEAVDADTKAKQESAEAKSMKDVLQREKDDLANAEKAYQEALAGKGGVQQKIDALKQKQAELCAKIKALEAESKAMGHELTFSREKSSKEKVAVDQAKAGIDSAAARAAAEAAEAEQAKANAMTAQERLAKAEQVVKDAEKGAGDVDAVIAKEQKDYDVAKDKWTKEQNDVNAAEKRVARAKEELAKYEEAPNLNPLRSGAMPAGATAAVALLATLLAFQ